MNTDSGELPQTLHNLPGTYSAAVCCCMWGATEQTVDQDRGSELNWSEEHWDYKKLPAGDELQTCTVTPAK